MQKLIYYSIVAVILALSILVMNADLFLSTGRTESENVPLHISALKTSLEHAQWESAQQEYQALTGAWQIIKPRIQFSVEKNQMDAIDAGLARLAAYIRWRDRVGAAVELSEIEAHWHDLRR
ncbi:MAG: DUF4363 family protein [Syntrophomonadaceae bacterium]|jgi:uncharacterized protein YfkK (UPF0435 family)|nr:DUF4363 family protein [Syntrophomonadaceae bacterium]